MQLGPHLSRTGQLVMWPATTCHLNETSSMGREGIDLHPSVSSGSGIAQEWGRALGSPGGEPGPGEHTHRGQSAT